MVCEVFPGEDPFSFKVFFFLKVAWQWKLCQLVIQREIIYNCNINWPACTRLSLIHSDLS